ncbi:MULTISPECIES: hypothetical protein [Streptomyces]|uniref:hypothetical protein n=1 Tax=Streptomyces TaxID=1883 RepID=UPI0008302EDB|nr:MULTISPECIES: hypothetical protein [Streptomyces]MDN5381186.1 hypothetical protein [Streptomyces sp. LB8]
MHVTRPDHRCFPRGTLRSAGAGDGCEAGPEVLDRAEAVRDRHCDLDPDLTDAVDVVLADVHSTEAVLTTDRKDFRAMRPLGRVKAFGPLPGDS